MTDACFRREAARPRVEEVHKVLTDWGGVIVHFSGVPPGMASGERKDFPDDLKYVLAGSAQGGISCSTVRPGDTFEFQDLETTRRNSWGCIGVIVRARSPWSLVCVHSSDCGSFVHEGFRYCDQGNNDLSLKEIAESLEARSSNGCNEWVMRDYDCLGVLVQHPYSIRRFGECATPYEILDAFGGWPLYTIFRDNIYAVTGDWKLGDRISILDLYPA